MWWTFGRATGTLATMSRRGALEVLHLPELGRVQSFKLSEFGANKVELACSSLLPLEINIKRF